MRVKCAVTFGTRCQRRCCSSAMLNAELMVVKVMIMTTVTRRGVGFDRVGGDAPGCEAGRVGTGRRIIIRRLAGVD